MSFRRYVRKMGYTASLEIPLEVVQGEMRHNLTSDKHSVLEKSWTDIVGMDGDDWMMGRPSKRYVSVRYVTGGMRHRLSPSLDWEAPFPNIVELQPLRGSLPDRG